MSEWNEEAFIDTEVPDLEEWRAYVDGLPEGKTKLLIQSIYLGASRVDEIVTKVNPYDLQHKKTKPYGRLVKWKLDRFGNGKEIENVLLLNFAVLKRKVRGKKKQRKQKVVRKIVALPVNPKYEPWTIPLLRRIEKAGTFAWNMTRRNVLYLVKKYCRHLDSEITTHSLRHFRLTHLAAYYDFKGFDLTAYSGWTFKTGLAAAGQMTSGQLDTYLHLAWKTYFPKLLKPPP